MVTFSGQVSWLSSKSAALKGFFRSEAGAAVWWLLVSLLLAASIAPLLHHGGKAFAATAAARELPELLEWLGASCGRADFSRYFNRALTLTALLLLPILYQRICWIRKMNQVALMPTKALPWKSKLAQIVAGFIITAVISWALCELITISGAYVSKAYPPDLGQVASRIFLPVVVVAFLEEWLFRGILLGLWSRVSKPLTACVCTSLFFAFAHFLSLPKGVALSDPRSAWAGFELLGKIGLHLMNPVFLVTDFLTLFGIGMVLAWARFRTGALWLSIGLHAGWIAVFKTFNQIHRRVEDHWLFPLCLGETLRSGLLPLLSILLIALLCRWFFATLEAHRTGA